jgi:hypothetical protein
VHGLRRMYHGQRNRFGAHPVVRLVNVCEVEVVFIHLETVLVSMQDMCTVCTECTSGWKSFWLYPMVLLDNIGQEETRFGLFGDSVNLSAR